MVQMGMTMRAAAGVWLVGAALGALAPSVSLAQSNGALMTRPPVLDATPSGNGPNSNLIVPQTGNGGSGVLVDPATAPKPAAPRAAPPAAPKAAPTLAAIGQPKVASYGDWSTECFTPAVQGVRCQVAHRVTSGSGHQVVLAISMAYNGKAKQTRIQMAFPWGVALGAGVRLEIGSGFQSDLPLNRCTAQGCLIEGVATADLLAAMNKGVAGEATVWTEAGSPVKLPFSLRGFAAAYTAMLTANGSTDGK